MAFLDPPRSYDFRTTALLPDANNSKNSSSSVLAYSFLQLAMISQSAAVLRFYMVVPVFAAALGEIYGHQIPYWRSVLPFCQLVYHVYSTTCFPNKCLFAVNFRVTSLLKTSVVNMLFLKFLSYTHKHTLRSNFAETILKPTTSKSYANARCRANKSYCQDLALKRCTLFDLFFSLIFNKIRVTSFTGCLIASCVVIFPIRCDLSYFLHPEFPLNWWKIN